MPNFFKKFIHSSSSSTTVDDKKHVPPAQTSTTQATPVSKPGEHSPLKKKTSGPEHENKRPDLQSIFSITVPPANESQPTTAHDKSSFLKNSNPQQSKDKTAPANSTNTKQSIFSLIIDSTFLNDEEQKGGQIGIFDPDPAVEEKETFNHDVVSHT